MWILDTAYRDGGIDLWTKERGTVTKVHRAYIPEFYARFHDPHTYPDMIAALEKRYGARECTIRTIFGEDKGWAISAGREVAETIEHQVQYAVDLYNVDVRRDQRFMAEQGIVPCTGERDDRFSPEISHDLAILEIRIRGNPSITTSCTDVEVIHGRTERLTGKTKAVLVDLFGLVGSYNPDVILMPDADTWMSKIRTLAQQYNLIMPFSRNGKYRQMDSRSYWSYGRMEHKAAALVPDGRILIDTEQSFVYHEGGLDGVLMAARLSGISPNLASRFTPGTLISSYETYEAIKKGIGVPFRKSDPELVRKLPALLAADRGGMMFQPNPGVFENVDEIDFTSMYPSIIVQSNLSPETIGHTERAGFLPAVLKPLLDLRIATKRLKKTDPRFAGTDAILKWMLVTCFGYTGYKNAKFGRIEVHEGITRTSREILLQTKKIAETMGFRVLHGIVDCLWVQGTPVNALMEQIEKTISLFIEADHFDWIVFLPLADGFGAYNRYYGRQPDQSIKVRGIAARRHDTPAYVREMQRRMLYIMKRAATITELIQVKDEISGIFWQAVADLPNADPEQMTISRRISRLTYTHRCLEGAAVQAYRDRGVTVSPGMKIQYTVTDASRYQVAPAWCADTFDPEFYRGLLDRAYAEITFAFAGSY
ncbi:MAG: type B DNA-directed DNA polymerase [Methanoregula sp.]|uniref:type B DNA-directed DNA polymerase n=1 Tax=Methanoregula sp. TaxID=2052170 RepID=UPI003BAF7CB5